MNLRRSICLGLAIASFGGLKAMADAGDVWLATKAKIALLTTEGVSVKDVDIEVAGGAVTLHGKVRTGAEKAKAGAAVKGVVGVKSVRNMMRVAPQAFNGGGKTGDEAIRHGVEAALRADQHLEGVQVASVNNGVVALAGTAVSLDEKLRAIELAWSVFGVSRVTSRIETGK